MHNKIFIKILFLVGINRTMVLKIKFKKICLVFVFLTKKHLFQSSDNVKKYWLNCKFLKIYILSGLYG